MSQYAAPAPSQPDHTWVLPSVAPSARVDKEASPGPAILSLILALLALLGVLALAGWMFLSGIPLLGETKSPLTGKLPAVPTYGALAGARLAPAVSATVEQDVGVVSNLKCPETPRVAQGVVTVCHGSISGNAWSVVVFFENRDGQFTVLPV